MADSIPSVERVSSGTGTALTARIATTFRRALLQRPATSLWVVLLGCVVAAALAAFIAVRGSDSNALAEAALVRLSAESYGSAYASVRAAAGDANAFEAVEQARGRMQEAASRLAEHSGAAGTAEAARHWEALKTRLDALSAQRERVTDAAKLARSLNERGPALHDAVEQIGALMLRSGATTNELAAVQRVDLLTQRIAQNATLLLAAMPAAPDLASSLQSDADIIDRILIGLLEGSAALRLAPQRNPEVRRQLSALRETLNGNRGAAAMLTAYSPNLNAAKSAAAEALSKADAIAAAVEKARSESRSVTAGRRAALVATITALVGAGLACLGLIFRLTAPSRAQPAQGESNNLATADTEVRPNDALSAAGLQGASPRLPVANLRHLAEQIQDAADKVADIGGRAERAAKRRMSQLADFAVEWELSSEELTSELAQVSAELERAVGSLTGDDWTGLEEDAADLDEGPPSTHQRRAS